MPIIRKRRAQAEASPPPTPTGRRPSPEVSDASSADEDVDGEADADGNTQGPGSSHEQMVKKLVRLALASEYSRQPIRRTDITAKVLAPHAGRQFKNIFAEANHHLRSTFGMEMTELPNKEKVTISQKRAAQRSQTSSSSTKSYILTSTLPSSLRIPPILPPPQVPVSSVESSYVGFYTFVVSLIYLSPGGTIAESRLEKHLQRMNADNFVLGEKVEKVLKKLEREGYIVKVRERDGGGEESVDYVVGPRGKAEIGERGAAGLVRSVYGKRDVEKEELDRRLVRSLGDMVVQKRNGRAEEETQPDGAEGGHGNVEESERRRSTREKKATPAKPTERRRGRSAIAQEVESEDGEDGGDGEVEEDNE